MPSLDVWLEQWMKWEAIEGMCEKEILIWTIILEDHFLCSSWEYILEGQEWK